MKTMEGDDLQGKTPFEKGKAWRLWVNEGEKTKAQLEAFLEEFSGDWGPSTKEAFKAGYAGKRNRPWEKWLEQGFSKPKGY